MATRNLADSTTIASTTQHGVVELAADGESNAAKVPTSNDSRMADARPPTAHAASHATAGSDPLAPADIGAANAVHTHTSADVTDFTEASQDVTGALIAAAGGTYDDATGTITLPSGGHVIKDNGSALTQRSAFNIVLGSSGATLADDAANDQTTFDVSSLTGGGGGGSVGSDGGVTAEAYRNPNPLQLLTLTSGTETIIPGCDWTASTPGASDSVSIAFDFRVSANSPGNGKTFTVRLRRGGVTGTVLYTRSLSGSLDTANGENAYFAATITDTPASSDTRYVLTCQSVAGPTYSARQSFTGSRVEATSYTGQVIAGADLAHRPAAANAGSLYLPTDAPNLYRDTGSAWQAFGKIAPQTPPVLANMTWIAQSNASAMQRGDALYLFSGGNTDLICSGLMQAVPAAPYRLAVRMQAWITVSSATFNNCGIFLHDSVSGKEAAFSLFQDKSSQVVFPSRAYFTSNGGGWNTWATIYDFRTGRPIPEWFGLYDDGTTRYYQISFDGLYWHTVYSEAHTGGGLGAPTHGGVYVGGGSELAVWSLSIN